MRLLCLLLALVLIGCGGTTATPVTSQSITAALEKSGLPITGVQAFTAETDPNKLLGRPGQYTVKVSWKDTRALAGAQGGDATIEVYPDLDAAKKRAEYITEIGKASAPLLQYVYLNEKHRAVLRAPKDLTPDQAKGYQDWLNKL